MRYSALLAVLLVLVSVVAIGSAKSLHFDKSSGTAIILTPTAVVEYETSSLDSERSISRREDSGCPSPRPNSNNICIKGVWTYFNTTVTSGGSLDATMYAVDLTGSLYMGPDSKLVTKGLGAGVWVQNCAQLEGTITISLSKADIEQIGRDRRTKYGSVYDILESSCSASSKAKVEVVSAPTECRRWKTSLRTRSLPRGRYMLSFAISPDHTRCNYWWIILISILLITPAVIFVLWVIYRLCCKKSKPKTRTTVRIQE